jgi:hypothetical protein
MPRIQTLRKCDRNTWFNENSAVDTPEPPIRLAMARKSFEPRTGMRSNSSVQPQAKRYSPSFHMISVTI